MLNLLSPLTLGRLRLLNRIVLSALPSGFATPDGFVGGALAEYYVERARGGAGLLTFEHTSPLPPSDSTTPHLGLYADAQVADLHHCIAAIHHEGAAALVMLDQPLALAALSAPAIDQILLALRHYGLPLRPALIVVGVVEVDFERSQTWFDPGKGFRRPSFELHGDTLVPRATAAG